MDDDTERRGGPAVHAAFAQSSGDARLGASLAILAADLAAGFAWELLGRAPFPAARRLEATASFARMHFEVVSGQQLDLCHHEDVALTHTLKTGSYTVRGPLALGALLGNASPRTLAALERFGSPVGMAFQLRDDLLGTFGDPAAVGKPVGADLRAGKRTALVAEAQDLLAAGERRPLEAVLGVRDASDGAIFEATHLLERSGARARVEARLDALLADAKNALYDQAISDHGRHMLLELLELLLLRDR
jgi:geranylgeranyl diphosphate synthase type I